MANNPKRIQDPTEAAMSAIQEALNLREDPAPKAPRASEPAPPTAPADPFANMTAELAAERPTRGSEIRFPTWQLLKQDFVVVGRVLDTGDGGYRVEYELYDIARQERLLGLALSGRGKGLRDVAHQIADQIYEKILGVRGAFWTRIAYVTMTGIGPSARYALMVADSDGFNPQPVTRSGEPLLSPAWSPDGKRIAYVSFERGNSTVYVQEMEDGSLQFAYSGKYIGEPISTG